MLAAVSIALNRVSAVVLASNEHTDFDSLIRFMMICKKGVVGRTCNAFFVSVICLFSSSFSLYSHADCPPFAATEAVIISQIIDGDTVHLRDGRKVRLIGINSPEISRDGKPDQAFARAAKTQLQQLLANQKVTLLTGREKHDKYGRVLAHLYIQRHNNIAAQLLQQGLGFHIAIAPNTTLNSCLAKAEYFARQHRLGVWSSSGIIPVTAAALTTGGFHRIVATVTKVTLSNNAWWLSLDNHIAAVIYPENQWRFNKAQLASLRGQRIEIRGWAYPSKSKRHEPWRIKLATTSAFNIIP